MKMNVLRLGFQIERSEIYGPGIRSVYCCKGALWLARVVGTHNFAVQRGDLFDVDRLLSELTDRQDIEGITLLGGEPLQQAPQVEKLMTGARSWDSLCSYTGYEMDELDPTMKRCIDLADIVVMGRFVQALRNTICVGGVRKIRAFVKNSNINHGFSEQNEVEIHLDTSGG